MGGALSGRLITVEWIEITRYGELLTMMLELCRGHKGPLMPKENMPSGMESNEVPAVEDPAEQEN